MFGFAFFILIVVSAYVANLAAFLTRRSTNHVGSIEDAVGSGMKICAHPALEDDLVLAHPDARFIFNQEGKELYGLVDDYDVGKCDVMAVGKMDSLGDLKLMDLFCQRGLVYTESLIIENPVGFPIRSGLASGFSYWMYQGEKYHGINVQSSWDAYDAENKRKPSCNVILSEQDGASSEFTRITAQNLIFPIMFFLGFAILAVILQLYHQRAMRKNKGNLRSLVGRSSTLNLYASSKNVGRSMDKIKQEEEEESRGVPQNNVGRSLDNIYDEEEESRDAGAKNNLVSSIATGTILSDTVHLDGFQYNGRDHTANKKVSFSFDASFEDNGALSNGGDNATLSQLDTGVLDKLDEFIACYQTLKRRKGGTK